jgi:ABC-type uncharacterized transport system ATPase subunit
VPPLVELVGITKAFPGCLANDDVSLVIAPNQIHALLGENGAGKSTLVKIISGVLRPDAGQILWNGAPVSIRDPAHARALGIGMVFQHFSLFEALTVADNIALGLNDARERVGLRARIIAVSQSYGLPVDPDRVVHDLSVGERQRIEIVRCLLRNPKLLIMDEPTSVLTPQEAAALFTTLRRLAAEGCSILYISHKLDEVRALCEVATIMRQGRVVARCVPAEKTTRELASLMIGTNFKLPAERGAAAVGAPRLVVDRLSLPATSQFGTALQDISFSVAGGEILGIAGIAGNGQGELMDALSGEILASTTDTIRLDDTPVGQAGPQDRRRRGGCFVPEERNGHGAVAGMSLTENFFLSGQLRGVLARFGLIRRDRTENFAERVIKNFDVRTSGTAAQAKSLSGGNLQKFLVGREMLLNPAVLVVSQPTWGVDASAAQAIHEAIIALAASGAAVVVISQDLDEILLLADRIAVIAAGRLSEPLPAAEATLDRIGLLMGGVV